MILDMMNADDYYAQKASFVPASVDYHRTH